MKPYDLEHFLIDREEKYGGFTGRVPRKGHPASPLDDRPPGIGWERGGDRMSVNHHYYAPIYARFLIDRLRTTKTIVEVGILTGVGLATWADVFPAGTRLIGLDVAPSYFEQNRDNLVARGAFLRVSPEIFKFDQYVDDGFLVRKILRGDLIDIVIDDGCHTNEAIVRTVGIMRPFLSSDFLYFVEDNAGVADDLRRKFPDLDVSEHREGYKYKDSIITILRPKK